MVGKGSRYVLTILLYVSAFVCRRTQMLAKVFTNKHDCTCIGIGGIASCIFCMSTHNKKIGSQAVCWLTAEQDLVFTIMVELVLKM